MAFPLPLDTNFVQQAVRLSDLSNSAGIAPLLGGEARSWQTPAPNFNPVSNTGWSGDPLDLDTIEYAYDRTASNKNYVAAATDRTGDYLSDRVVAKFTCDYLAVQERAFRARHCTSVRAAYLAANRRKGQGVPQFGVWQTAVQYALDLQAEGYP